MRLITVLFRFMRQLSFPPPHTHFFCFNFIANSKFLTLLWAWGKPVAHERPQNHQAVLQTGDKFGCAVSSQQQLPTVLKASECESLVVPFSDHLLQLLLNISLFDCTDADILQKRSPQIEKKEKKYLMWRLESANLPNKLNHRFVVNLYCL